MTKPRSYGFLYLLWVESLSNHNICVVVVVKWSAFSPSTLTIRVRIPLKPRVFSVKFVFEKTKDKQKEAGAGTFLKRIGVLSFRLGDNDWTQAIHRYRFFDDEKKWVWSEIEMKSIFWRRWDNDGESHQERYWKIPTDAICRNGMARKEC